MRIDFLRKAVSNLAVIANSFRMISQSSVDVVDDVGKIARDRGLYPLVQRAIGSLMLVEISGKLCTRDFRSFLKVYIGGQNGEDFIWLKILNGFVASLISDQSGSVNFHNKVYVIRAALIKFVVDTGVVKVDGAEFEEEYRRLLEKIDDGGRKIILGGKMSLYNTR